MASAYSTVNREQTNHPREFADFAYVYPVISRRSGGVSIGVNLNPDKLCNFDCPYCQVDRTIAKPKLAIKPEAIRAELEALLGQVDGSGVCRLDRFASIPDEAKHLKDISVSGDGEPTMAPEFPEVCVMLASLQASRPDVKLVLITNSTLLDRKETLAGIGHLLSRNGEVWAKLDAGTEAWFQKINVSRTSLDRIEANLIRLGRDFPFAIQSLFCALDGVSPPEPELEAYLARLTRIKESGSRISEVQLYTLARKPAQAFCTPVSREFLEDLAHRIESIGLRATVYGIQA